MPIFSIPNQNLNFGLPGEGTIFRTDRGLGGGVYRVLNGQLTGINGGQFGAAYRQYNPQSNYNTTDQFSPSAIYDVMFGNGAYNQLPIYNLADIQTAYSRATGNPAGSLVSSSYNDPASIRKYFGSSIEDLQKGSPTTADPFANSLTQVSNPTNPQGYAINNAQGGFVRQTASLASALQGGSSLAEQTGARPSQIAAMQNAYDLGNTSKAFSPSGIPIGMQLNQQLASLGGGSPIVSPAINLSPESIASSGNIGTGNTAMASSSNNATGNTAGNTADNTRNNIFTGLETASQVSPEYLKAQQELDALTARQIASQIGLRQSEHNIEGQPIPYEFVTGQKAALERQAALDQEAMALQKMPLEQRLSRLQAQRQAAIDVAKEELAYQKPFTVPFLGGVGRVNAQGGITVTGGVNEKDKDILGKLTAAGIDINHYNIPGMIAAVESGIPIDTIIANRANYKAEMKQGGLLQTTVTPTAEGGTKRTQRLVTPPTDASPSSPILGTPFSSTGAYQAGQLTKLLQLNGMPTDDASLAKLYSKTVGKGQYVNDVAHNSQIYNALQNGGQTSIPFSLSQLSSGALNRLTTGDFRRGDRNAVQQNNIDKEIRDIFPNFNPQIAKGNAKAISEQISKGTDVARGITAADSNFKLLVDTFSKANINDMQSPLANSFANAVKKGLLGEQDVINFKSAIATLQTEYATVLGRGGEVTNEVRKSAQDVVNGTYSMKDLISLHDYIVKESKNVIDSYTKVINGLVSGGGSVPSIGGQGLNTASQSILQKYGIK